MTGLPTPTGRDHVEKLHRAIAGFAPHTELASAWGRELATTLTAGGRLLAVGNGGSAAQAQHLTAELVGRYREDRRPLSAICLSAETSSLTAIANDFPPEELFARQVEAHGRPGDVLIVLSTSGRSPNALGAARRGLDLGLHVWALTGPAPNPLADLVHDALCVDAPFTATVQELHLVALHLICASLDAAVADADADLSCVGREPDAARVPPDAAVAVDDASARPVVMASVGPDLAQHEPARPQPTTPRRVQHQQTRRSSAGRRGPIVVVGDALLDIDQCGRVSRLCPDAPVPVLEDTEDLLRPGGAALAAELLARDGHQVVLVTPIADDGDAARLLSSLHPGVDVVRVPYSGSTSVKRRLRASGQSLLRVDSGRSGEVGAPPEAAVAAVQDASAVLVADYGRGAAAEAGMRALLTRRADGVPLVWDPHPRGPVPVAGAHLVTPNSDEAALFAPETLPASSDLATAGARAADLVSHWQARAVVVTLGAKGSLLSFGEGAPSVVPAPVVEGHDSCGAGDRFASAATAALAGGALVTEAVQQAVSAASAFVAAGGAAGLGTVAGADDGASGADAAATGPASGAVDARTLAARVQARGGTVVATGGCFDLLHAGHVENLRAARALGDCLVVCLNSDPSVRRLKGPGRPVVPQTDRAQVLLALEHVDAVMVFEEDTPEAVLRLLRPDVWVKGGDYAGDRLVEADVLREWQGTAVVLPYLQGRSTTGMVQQAVAAQSLAEGV